MNLQRNEYRVNGRAYLEEKHHEPGEPERTLYFIDGARVYEKDWHMALSTARAKRADNVFWALIASAVVLGLVALVLA